jgi:hypothetical protein
LSSRFKVDPKVVDLTSMLIRLAIELDEYWRRSSPSHEVDEKELAEVLRLLDEMSRLLARMREMLSSKPWA